MPAEVSGLQRHAERRETLETSKTCTLMVLGWSTWSTKPSGPCGACPVLLLEETLRPSIEESLAFFRTSPSGLGQHILVRPGTPLCESLSLFSSTQVRYVTGSCVVSIVSCISVHIFHLLLTSARTGILFEPELVCFESSIVSPEVVEHGWNPGYLQSGLVLAMDSIGTSEVQRTILRPRTEETRGLRGSRDGRRLS